MKPLIRLISFLFGFLITLCIYLFSTFISKKQIDIYETYTNVSETTNTDTTTNTDSTAIATDDSTTITLPKITKESTIDELVIADAPPFPYTEHIFMFLSSINHTENISNNELKPKLIAVWANPLSAFTLIAECDILSKLA